jgi:hypothetical protein
MNMAMTRQRNRREGGVKIIKIECEGNQEQDVTVCRENALQRKERSGRSRHEGFVIEWSETFVTKRRKEYSRKGARL